MNDMIKYRIIKKEYKNHTEWWVQECKPIWWGILINWQNTTLSYYTSEQSAKEALEDLIGKPKISIVK